MNAYERAQTKVLRVSGATVHKQATKAKVARPDRACPRYREEKSPVLQLKNRARRSRNAPYDTLTLMTPYVISDLRQSHGTSWESLQDTLPRQSALAQLFHETQHTIYADLTASDSLHVRSYIPVSGYDR